MKKGFTLGAKHIARLQTKAKFGFTLAEVLITLGIIGVVASMTIPTLINKQWEQERKTLIKKSYSTMSEAIKRIVANNDGYAPACHYTNGGSNFTQCPEFYKQLKEILVTVKECDNQALSNGCIGDIEDMHPSGGCSGFAKSNIDTTSMAFVTADGMSIFGYYLDKIPLVGIDINGPKPPNKWGHDVYSLKWEGDDSSSLRVVSGGCFMPNAGGETWDKILLNALIK